MEDKGLDPLERLRGLMEPDDLRVILNFGLVGYGRLGDILEVRRILREHGLKIVYNTISTRRLRVVKEDGYFDPGRGEA